MKKPTLHEMAVKMLPKGAASSGAVMATFHPSKAAVRKMTRGKGTTKKGPSKRGC